MDVARTFLTAMILAFIFRAFLVEAFVIPTGSMAMGLLGAHRVYMCPACGTGFTVSAAEDSRRDAEAPRRARCPNCFQAEEREASPASWRSGDRILVHKWVYDFGAMFSPRRWDVIVFRDPADPNQNYIKRLVGLPFETVEIVAGDVYIDGRIARKPLAIQSRLWLPVYHQDRVMPDASPFFTGPVWSEELEGGRRAAWSGLSTRVIRHTANGAEAAALSFARGASPLYHQDYSAYNGQSSGAQTRDVRVEFELDSIEQSGRLTIELALPEARHELHLHGDGRIELTSRMAEDSRIEQQTCYATIHPVRHGVPLRVAFAAVDDALYAWFDGELLLSTADQPGRDVLDARRLRLDAGVEVRLVAQGWTFELHKLRIDRDVFYTRRPGTALRAYAGAPFALGQGEYFVLGDNSAASHDARDWRASSPHLPENYRLGTVLRSEIVGRAFFVYLPGMLPLDSSGYWRVPDLGRLRFVR